MSLHAAHARLQTLGGSSCILLPLRASAWLREHKLAHHTPATFARLHAPAIVLLSSRLLASLNCSKFTHKLLAHDVLRRTEMKTRVQSRRRCDRAIGYDEHGLDVCVNWLAVASMIST